MKTLIKTRIVAIALVAALTVAFTTPVLANTTGENPQAVELKYLGQYKNQPVFELTFKNSEEADFTVVIRDEQDNIVYKDFIKSGTTSKKYMLNTEELGDIPVNFEITSRKTDKTVVYKVNKNTRVVEDVVVNLVK
jgi:hypothetical protein